MKAWRVFHDIRWRVEQVRLVGERRLIPGCEDLYGWQVIAPYEGWIEESEVFTTRAAARSVAAARVEEHIAIDKAMS